MRTRVDQPKRRLVLGGLGLMVGLLLTVPVAAQDAPSRAPQDSRAGQTDQADNQAIQQELAVSKQAPPAKAVPEAQSVSARNGSRFLVSGYTEIRFTNIGSAAGDRAANNVTDFQVARFRPRF